MSTCISKGPDRWIDHWLHNAFGWFDTPALAVQVIPEGASEIRVFALYPGATHSFDFDAPPRRNEYGKHLAYDSDATRDAAKRVADFLRDVVK